MHGAALPSGVEAELQRMAMDPELDASVRALVADAYSTKSLDGVVGRDAGGFTTIGSKVKEVRGRFEDGRDRPKGRTAAEAKYRQVHEHAVAVVLGWLFITRLDVRKARTAANRTDWYSAW